MNLNVVQKTKLEQRIVLSLLGVFVFVMLGALRNMGVLGSRSVKRPTPLIDHVDVSRPLAETFQEHWKRMEPPQELQTPPAGPVSSSASAPLYTAQSLRDPLKSLLPEIPPPQTSILSSTQTGQQPKPETPMPTLTVQGLWLQGQRVRAIINGEVYGIGDQVQGVTITSIDRNGVTVEFGGRTVQLPMTTQGAKSPLSQTAGWR